MHGRDDKDRSKSSRVTVCQPGARHFGLQNPNAPVWRAGHLNRKLDDYNHSARHIALSLSNVTVVCYALNETSCVDSELE